MQRGKNNRARGFKPPQARNSTSATSAVDDYFGVHHGLAQAPILRNGTNYTNIALAESMKLNDTEKILALINSRRKMIVGGQGYTLVENHAGIGTSSLCFADLWADRVISNLLLVEADKTKRDMLENNLNTYAYGNEIVVRDHFSLPQGFDGGVAVLSPIINYLDPIELPATNSTNSNTMIADATNGSNVTAGANDMTIANQIEIDQWRQDWHSQKMFTGPVRGVNISLLDLLHKVTNMELVLVLLPVNFPLLTLQQQQNNFPAWTFDSASYYNFQVLIASNEVGRNLAVLSQKQERENYERSWLPQLIQFLRELLGRISAYVATQANMVPLDPANLVTPEFHYIWKRAFTHLSWYENDPEKEKENYEALENVGDRAQKGAWASFIFGHYPDLDQQALTQYDNTYMSKHYQPLLTEKLGLERLLLRSENPGKPMYKLREDLFESFSGALMYISDRMEGPGIGMIRVYQLIAFLFPVPPAREDLQPIISKVKELLEASWFGWERLKPVWHHGSVTVAVNLPPDAQQFFSLHGLVVARELGSASGTELKKVEQAAMIAAWNKLQSLGLSKKKLSELSSSYRIIKQNYGPALEAKMKIRGAKILYAVPTGEKDGKQLITLFEGYSNDADEQNIANRRKVVFTMGFDMDGKGNTIINWEQIKANMVQYYITQLQ